jgi:hypothetical protein
VFETLTLKCSTETRLSSEGRFVPDSISDDEGVLISVDLPGQTLADTICTP